MIIYYLLRGVGMIGYALASILVFAVFLGEPVENLFDKKELQDKTNKVKTEWKKVRQRFYDTTR